LSALRIRKLLNAIDARNGRAMNDCSKVYLRLITNPDVTMPPDAAIIVPICLSAGPITVVPGRLDVDPFRFNINRWRGVIMRPLG
jgi:hypothetical protein